MIKRTRLYCTGTPQMTEAIDVLLWQGLHGKSRSEVIERLLAQAVEHNIVRGHLKHAQLREAPNGRCKALCTIHTHRGDINLTCDKSDGHKDGCNFDVTTQHDPRFDEPTHG